MALPTEPIRLVTSFFGITMKAGPASVIPYEFDTVASGSRSCSVNSVGGASGALPIETDTRLDRSGSANRGCATISSAIAGTRNAHDGRSRSTIANHSSTSNFGR